MATPPAYGLTAEGYAAPTAEPIRAWLRLEWKEIFGQNSPIGATTPNGKIIDFATRLAVVLFEGGAGAANAGWFTGARGVALEKELALFAFPRIPASSSQVEIVAYGDEATLIGGGSLVSVETVKDRYITTDAITLTGNQGYVVRIKNASTGDSYGVEIAGQPWSYVAQPGDGAREIAEGVRDAIIAGGQQVTAVVPPDDDADGFWLVVVEDNGLGPFVLTATQTGAADTDAFQAKRVTALAELQGPREALAGTVNVIETQIAGWVGVTSTADATLGSNAESDAAYRARHREQLMGKGSASVQAIRDSVAQLDGVTFCKVRENDTDVVDGEGLPPHSFRVTVLGGDDDEIAETIFKKKPAGIKTYGNTSTFVLDGEGLLKEINFERPLKKYVWVEIVIVPGEKYPQAGTPLATIAAEVASWGDANLTISDDVERFALGTPINVVPGVKGATVTLGYTLNENDPQPVMVAADLVMASTELPLFDSARVLVSL
jgi:hypothetical protein